MKTHKLALLIILSVIVFQVDAQISSVVDTQIELDSDSRAVITSVNKHKFSFKKPVLDLVLPVKNISVSVAEDAATPKSVALSVRGLSSDGKILFPLFISHGMRIEPHENGTFEIPLSLCTGSIFVFSGEVSSVELEVNGNQGQNIYMEFDEITSFQLSEIRRANHASCEFNHLALLVDDSKSNAKELSNILSRIDSILLSQNKIKKVSLISLNTRGRFVTFDIEESTLRRNLASFNSFEKLH